VPVYYALCCPGLEDVVSAEIGECDLEVLVAEARLGWVIFAGGGTGAALPVLRSVDAVGLWLGSLDGLEPGAEGLCQIEEWAASLEVSDALAHVRAIRDLPRLPHFRVSAHRVGTHSYTSMDLAAAVGGGIQRDTGWPVRMRGYDINIVLRVTGRRAMAGLELCDSAAEGAGPRPGGAARLKRGVAHCLVRMLGLAGPELVMDPMCGTGSIVLECVHLHPGARVLGGDMDGRALGIAAERSRAVSPAPGWVRWDARAIPLRSGCVDGVVCNLPFGRRVGSHRRNEHLYPGFFRELYRVLRPGGRAVLLTLEKRMTERLISKHHGLRVAGVRVVELSGLHPSVYELEKLA